MKRESGIARIALLLVLLGAAVVRPAHAQFGDTTLTRLIGEGLAGNRDLQVAQARLRGARASQLGAALDLAPAVTAAGGYSRQRQSNIFAPGGAGAMPDQGIWDAGLLMAWDIDVFGRARRALAGQGAFVASAQEDVRDVQLLLASAIATTYYELRGTQERLATARRNAENQRRTLELTQQRLDAGRGSAFDTERARAQLASTLAGVPTLEAAIAALRLRIAVLIGRGDAALAARPDSAAAFPELPADLDVPDADSLARGRPDVRSARQQWAARSALVGAARADYLPRVSLAGSAGYTSSAAGAFANTGTGRYAIGPVVSWPALNLGRVKAGVDEASSAEAEARARYEQSVLGASAEIETAALTYRGARERLAHLEDAAAASERAAESARLRFREGATDFLQVLDAERTLLEAQDRLALGRTGAITALVAAYRALGTWPATGLR
jgi:NodT family efflux transporter outer membrane factor (OMF) lipoprotein